MESIFNPSFATLLRSPQRHHAIRANFKRGMDLAGAALALVLLSPLLFLITASVWVTAGAPILFSQWRVGRAGIPFRMLKFRTMHANWSDAQWRVGLDGNIDKRADDRRITRFGRFLRRSSLDELPQLINVLRGEMSLVGPRPLPRCMLVADPKSLELRCSLRPGMTGLWQICNRSANRSILDMLSYDLEYASKVSIRRDALILIQTLPAVIRGTGAI